MGTPWPDGGQGPTLGRVAGTWLIDGFNVLHAAWRGGGPRSDWWTRTRREELLERVRRFDEAEGRLVVVFDGSDGGGDDASRPRVVYAPSADAWILRRVKDAAAGEELVVVSGDRSLRDRCRHHGARVVSPRAFLERCR